jgi:hypothetical protein
VFWQAATAMAAYIYDQTFFGWGMAGGVNGGAVSVFDVCNGF